MVSKCQDKPESNLAYGDKGRVLQGEAESGQAVRIVDKSDVVAEANELETADRASLEKRCTPMTTGSVSA